MKKHFSVSVLILVFSLSFSYKTFAQEKPVQLSLFNPIQLYGENTSIVGIRINILYGKNSSVTGLDLGFGAVVVADKVGISTEEKLLQLNPL